MAERDEQSQSELPPALERRLDPLYRERPEEFVAARNRLAKELRAEGERAAAETVGKLRRPSQAAWLINRVSSEDAGRVRRFVAAVDELADAQRRVLEDEADPRELRDAASRERHEVEGMVEAARSVARAGGGRISDAVIARVAETLQAVGSSAELRSRALRGRVEREASAATLGVSGAPTVGGRRRGPARRPKEAEVVRARKELARLRERLEIAQARRDHEVGRVEAAEADLRRARADLAAAKREVKTLEREVAAAERDASGARRRPRRQVT